MKYQQHQRSILRFSLIFLILILPGVSLSVLPNGAAFGAAAADAGPTAQSVRQELSLFNTEAMTRARRRAMRKGSEPL